MSSFPDGRSIYCGDCLDVMVGMDENSVDTIITDPPYGLEFMGKGWDGQVPGEMYWREVLRVAKPGALLLAFGGTRTWHRLAVAIEDGGWELRDTLMWLYGSGFPKSHDVSKAIDKEAGAEREVLGPSRRHKGQSSVGGSNPNLARHASPDVVTTPATDAAKTWEGYGSALKPAYEPILVAMKPLDGTYAQNAQRWGVAGFWIDGGRIGTPIERRPGGWHHEHTINDDGWTGGEQTDRSPGRGRFPANLILDEEAAAALDEQSGDLTSGRLEPHHHARASENLSMSGGNQEGRVKASFGGDSGGASRFFYTAKASGADRVEGNTHPTVKPLSLMRYLCRLTRPPGGGVVLDPFMGSGSTLVAAQEEGRKAIGIELDEKWCEVAAKRLRQGVLFDAA